MNLDRIEAGAQCSALRTDAFKLLGTMSFGQLEISSSY